MTLRHAVLSDLDALAAVEAACFPPAEAASREALAARLQEYPQHFWVLEKAGQVVSFVNGMVTDEATIRDEMFENAALHNEQGAWQAVFGLNTLPQYRGQGFAARCMQALIAQAKAEGRRGCILTCKAALRPYYQRFGYCIEGVSASVHGGAVWYDMRLAF